MNFDVLMNSTKEGGKIQLESGVYVTRMCDGYDVPNGAFLKKGVRVYGPKVGYANIIGDPWTPDRDMTVVYGVGGHDFVGNITVTCPPPKAGRKYNGVYLGRKDSESSVIEGITQLGTSGDLSAHRESFGIAACGKESMISRCTVADVRGSYTTGIHIAFGGGSIINNTVYAPNRPAGEVALWALGSVCIDTGLYVALNRVIGPWRCGFYHDTGDSLYTQVVDNVFAGCDIGCWMNFQVLPGFKDERTLQEFHFSNNDVLLSAQNDLCVMASIANANNALGSEAAQHRIRDVFINHNRAGIMTDRFNRIQNRRVGLALTSHCTEPILTKHGISGVEFTDNTFAVDDNVIWTQRNMGGNAKSVVAHSNLGVKEEWVLS